MICGQYYTVLLEFICFVAPPAAYFEVVVSASIPSSSITVRLLEGGSFFTLSHQILVSPSQFELLICWRTLTEVPATEDFLNPFSSVNPHQSLALAFSLCDRNTQLTTPAVS